MKTKVTSLLVALISITISCTAQRTITVEAQNNDISNNLDLQAVASTFGDSKDLEDFERRLNDYDSQLSNLDLNNDGEVDYLRVIENRENNVHVVVIQAVLERDVYQDVATIVVEKRENRRTSVQVIGNAYLYGNNYIIEPVYRYTPSIYSFFWGYNYHNWYSPYYYGYYPQYYRNRHPFEVNYYMSHVYSHINYEHRYFYTDRHRNEYSERMHQTMSRNDYGNQHPDRNFTNRNSNIINKKEFDSRRSNNSIADRTSSATSNYGRSSQSNSGSRNDVYRNGSRTNENRNSNMNGQNTTPSNRNSGMSRTQDDVYQNRTIRTQTSEGRNNNRMQNNSGGTQTYTQPATPTNRNTEINRNSNREYQQTTAPSRNSESRVQPTVTRESNNTRPQPVVTRESNNRSTPAVVQPSKSAPATERNSTETGGRSSSGRR